MVNESIESKPHLQNFKEYLTLLAINFKTHAYNLVEFIRTIFRYYLPNFRFAKEDLALLITYLFNSPYVFSKRFLESKGQKEVYAYGETPLTTMEQIANECQFSSKDTIFELGSGRGRTCFWLQAFLNCRVVGIEFVPEFVEQANKIKEQFKVDTVEFRQEDMLEADLTGATAIYLYGTCLEDKAIKQLIQKFEKLPAGTKIVTVSYPLTDYTSSTNFEVMKRFPVRYPWGIADVYFHVKK